MEFLQLGAVTALFIFAIKEFFNYLKSRNVVGKNPQSVFTELQRMNDNHLTHIQSAITEGDAKVVKAINDGNLLIVQALGEIKGRLK